jgi:hypothetical protein
MAVETAIVSAALVVYGTSLESTICAVKLIDPDVVGVPEIFPVFGSKASPAGRAPETLHVNGAVPPAATSVAL